MQRIFRGLLNLALAACVWLAASIAGLAGDFAQREIIGFSPDGSRFAFEEYGVQDGSGFPYANIYVLDTINDQWISGSPFRVRIDDEMAQIADARNQVRQQAASALQMITEPGFLAATNTHTEISPDPHRIVAAPRSYIPSGSPNLEFRLDVYDVPGEDYCSADGTVKAFKLIQVSDAPGTATKLVFDDGNDIPSSRNCVLDYRFADIITYHANTGAMTGIVLIRVWSLGFEGPDGRYIAIPFRG